MYKILDKKLLFDIIQAITIVCWILFLENTDSYYFPYLVIAILGIICLYKNNIEKNIIEKVNRKCLLLCAGFFSVLVFSANYQIISNIVYPDYAGQIFKVLYKYSIIILMLIGGYFSACNILLCVIRSLKNFSWERKVYNTSPVIIFIVPFVIISTVNIVLLFLCKYPGNLTPDSMSQIGQLLSGNYSNHHPFYHTMVIKFFITSGLKIFGDINKAVAMYCVFQILFMAMSFSITILTLYKMNIPLKAVIGTMVWYTAMPFHIMYSFTVWKDVMFGGFVLIFLVFIFRILKGIGKHRIFNYLMFLVSSLGICLFRSNGLFAYIIVFLVLVILFYKTHKKVCFMSAGVILSAFLLKHAVLSNLGINQPDIVESLSVPLQQIARVIIEHNDFNNDERELLNKIADVDEIAGVYVPYISDPVKDSIRKNGDQKYFIDNKLQYIKLYIVTGLRHPLSYARAWIDETKGFWNGGYSYWRWADEIYQNDYGIKRNIFSEELNRYFNEYLWTFSNNNFLQLFLCIGFYVWIVLVLLFISFIRKDKTGMFILIPVLAIICSLLISTPVYSEFRYAYALFCCLPFMVFAVFYKKESLYVSWEGAAGNG